MTQEDVATLFGVLAATFLITGWISWRTGTGLAVIAAVLGVFAARG